MVISHVWFSVTIRLIVVLMLSVVLIFFLITSLVDAVTLATTSNDAHTEIASFTSSINWSFLVTASEVHTSHDIKTKAVSMICLQVLGTKISS